MADQKPFLNLQHFRDSIFVKDRPSETGMQCIYDWYYKDNAKRWTESLFPALEKHSNKPVGVIL